MSEVRIFVFAGRRNNLEIQLPLIRRILDRHPDVHCDVWNLTQNESDNEYVRTIEGDRITVHNEFYGPSAWTRFNDVWAHYCQLTFQDTTFVKLDDDVIYLETERFGDFIDAVRANPGSVISAQTINNGSSTRTFPGIWNAFLDLDIPLLDVHEHGSYAEMCHGYALDNWDEMIGQPVDLIPCADWLSINVIGFDWRTCHKIADGLGGRSPQHIAGRLFRKNSKLGDEGSVNRYPRKILKGFLAAHLTFGPQSLPEDVWDGFRKRYAELGQQYLETR